MVLVPPQVESPVPPFATERSVPLHWSLLIEAQVEAPRAESAVTNWLVQAAAPAYSAKTPPAPVSTRAEVRVSTSSWPTMFRLVEVALVEVLLTESRSVMVEEAEEMSPAVNWIKVEVELPSVVGVKGKEEAMFAGVA